MPEPLRQARVLLLLALGSAAAGFVGTIGVMDWLSLEPADRWSNGVAMLALVASGSAGWLAWKSSRRRDIRESTNLSAIAEKGQYCGMYGRRELENEIVTIRVYNGGRPIEIESIMLAAAKTRQAISDVTITADSRPLLLLETGRTHRFQFHASELQRMAPLLKPDKNSLLIKLADGECVLLQVKGLDEVFEDVEQYVRDLERGFEAFPHPAFYTLADPHNPDSGINIYGEETRSITWLRFGCKKIPDEAEIRISMNAFITPVGPTAHFAMSEAATAAEDAAWREGRNYREEIVDLARERRRQAKQSGIPSDTV